MKKIFYTMLVSLMSVIMITVIIFVSYKGFIIIRIIPQAIRSFSTDTSGFRDNSTEIFNEKFEVWKLMDEYNLMYREIRDGEDYFSAYSVLDLINNRKPILADDKSNAWYYFSSPDGYAIIEKNTLICRVYIKPERIGKRYVYGPVDGDFEFKAEREGIVIYLDSFEDFTIKEQEILKDMYKNRLWDYVIDDSSPSKAFPDYKRVAPGEGMG